MTLRGEPYLLWRAVAEHGAELDVLAQKRRDEAAAKRFFRRVLRLNPVPCEIVTDQLRSYPAAKVDIPELAHMKHVFVKEAARVNHAENSHQPSRRRERQMCGFCDARRTQAFLSWHVIVPYSRNVSPHGMVGLSLPQQRNLSDKENYA